MSFLHTVVYCFVFVFSMSLQYSTTWLHIPPSSLAYWLLSSCLWTQLYKVVIVSPDLTLVWKAEENPAVGTTHIFPLYLVSQHLSRTPSRLIFISQWLKLGHLWPLLDIRRLRDEGMGSGDHSGLDTCCSRQNSGLLAKMKGKRILWGNQQNLTKWKDVQIHQKARNANQSENFNNGKTMETVKRSAVARGGVEGWISRTRSVFKAVKLFWMIL